MTTARTVETEVTVEAAETVTETQTAEAEVTEEAAVATEATVEADAVPQLKEEHQENQEEMKRKEEDHVTVIEKIEEEEETMKIDFQKTQSKLKKFLMSNLPIFRKSKVLMCNMMRRNPAEWTINSKHL